MPSIADKNNQNASKGIAQNAHLEKISLICKNIVQSAKKNLAKDLILEMFLKIKNGKMLRSKLVLSIATKNLDSVYNLCAIIELIQIASLLHDDVIDEASKRRGAASINALYDNKSSIMLGDILYSSAFYTLASFDKEIVKSISKSVSSLSAGELLDVFLAKEFIADELKYLDMIELKSASLIGASSFSASFLESKNLDLAKLHYEFGINLGIAFQIIDDILDITQDEKILGKPNLSDYAQGKQTLPYIYLYEELKRIDSKKASWLKNLCGKKLDSKESKELLELIKTHSLEKVKQKAKSYSSKALKIAKKLNNKALEDIILQMTDRVF